MALSIRTAFVAFGKALPEDCERVLSARPETYQYTNDVGGQAGTLGARILYISRSVDA